jgi:hypothetical protein
MAFYLPGVAPHNYKKGDLVPLYVNSLTPIVSSNSQLKSVISYDYYYEPFHFCQPEGGPQKQSESLGSILFGDRIFNSPFQVRLAKQSLQMVEWFTFIMLRSTMCFGWSNIQNLYKQQLYKCHHSCYRLMLCAIVQAFIFHS